MKVLPFKIPKPQKEALVYQEDHEFHFYDQLHQHEEIQISFISKGSGSIIVGDSITEYQANDILIIGENIPHVFKSDSLSYKSVMYTLFFTTDSFGREFFRLTDLQELQAFFKSSEYGIKISSNHTTILNHFKVLKNKNPIERLASLLYILDSIIKSDKKLALSNFVYSKDYTEEEGNRMNNVFQYAMDNFQNPISLDDIANQAHMSKNGFCRYFKKRTNKTFLQFLIEIRIEHACKTLRREKELSISAVSYSCGFNNIANFNRKFKELKGFTPTEYRQLFQR
ncbi:transcriptional regulator, AraC family [Zunongwangia mangrovi]|uniref:Transcriptional regulator, AraC family n=1 Tax=Zunongwangia mangrovi TaxID=1334022 RepID=A0A1I1L179_9FLAO|nr:AraC family transcriptional regulator [Zunongwangia mangrovi]SFC66794.1 transcriptional regulator, AraC family [Zunongwangia mangrovi]